MTANLITAIYKKVITERPDNKPYTKNTAYWIHAIVSRIASIVNTVATIVAIILLFIGIDWLSFNFQHIFFITMCALMWILSLYLTWSFFQIRDKSHDTDAQGNNALIDPNDRAAINYAIGWILFNVTLDAIILLFTYRIETMPHQ